MKQNKTTLKTYFETGDKPTEEQFCDLIDSMLTDNDLVANSKKEFTYEQLKEMVQNQELIAGRKYILSDYKTQYYIEGTNSSNIVKTVTNKEVVNGYGLYDPPLSDTYTGVKVEVLSLPNNYTGSIAVGDMTTATVYQEGYYIRFSNGLQNLVGATFKYSLKRFKNIVEDTTIVDSTFKTMLKAGGVINTDVHDGTPYMQMTATENKAVHTEKIILTAITSNQFSIQSESLTYPGELLAYNFNDTEIKNEDEVVIGTRKGFIARRISADKKIDVNKDWRVQRYRRYKLSDADWENFILNNPADDQVYHLGSNRAMTASNTNITDAHKYVLPFVDMDNFYQDFSVSGTTENIFLSGVSNPGHMFYAGRMEETQDEVFRISVSVDVVDNGKDFFIFPLETDQANVPSILKPAGNVYDFKVNNLSNSVFLDNSSQYASSNRIEVNCTDGLQLSTFISGAIVLSNSENTSNGLSHITAIDNLILRNKGRIANLTVTTSSELANNGDIQYLTLGGMLKNATPYGVTYLDIHFDDLCRVRNTMIGGKRTDRLFFDNVQTNKCLFAFTRGQYLKISDSILLLTAIKHAGDFLTNNLSLDTTGVNTKKSRFGFLYEGIPNLSGKNIFTNNQGDLLYEVIDGANNNERSIVSLTLSK